LVDYVGPGAQMPLVIGRAGTLELVDTLRSAFAGAIATNFDVFRSPLTVADGDPWQVSAPCSTCLQCPVYEVCGGGYHPHRYNPPNGFDNPSVYCRDLMKLIGHIQTAVQALDPKRDEQDDGF
jgi:uncharacterized protein